MKLIITLGILIALVPVLGFPTPFEDAFLIIAGFVIALTAYTLRLHHSDTHLNNHFNGRRQNIEKKNSTNSVNGMNEHGDKEAHTGE